MEEIAQALSKTSWRTCNLRREMANKQKKTEKALLSTTGKIMLVPNLEFSLKSFHSFFMQV